LHNARRTSAVKYVPDLDFVVNHFQVFDCELWRSYLFCDSLFTP
jgi:hypothetical protein